MADDALIEQMAALTAALHELADSNRAVVDLVIAQQQDEDGESPARPTYLDGTPMNADI